MGCTALSRTAARLCFVNAGTDFGEYRGSDGKIRAFPETLTGRAELVFAGEPPVAPAAGHAKAATIAATILGIADFLPLLKRFYACFCCWKAVDSD